ncbi:MAG: agmatine deiminase family protein, partial [Candidatus Eisenbacteria sp.]|nr:agmatine deiminase family protein [Candidatus Eisenbacteria bacterium]
MHAARITLGLAVLITLLTLALAPGVGFAQTYKDAASAPGGTISLPHELTPEEMLILDEIGSGHRPTPPPSAQPVRNAAEFDRMEGVLISYPLGISTAIVRELAEDVIVYCIVLASQQASAYSTFQSAGVNMDNVVFFNARTDSHWTRDYGPWFIYDANLDCGIIDVIYNRPRPHDDQIPTLFAGFLGIEAYGPDLIHTGGNWMVDGHGIAASSELVWEENPSKTPEEINEIVQDYLGIHAYHVVPDPNGTYIDHIDCWGKFLAVDKILIREVAQSHSQYDEIEAVADYFANQVSSYGWPYQVIRVYTPGNEPYTNSLIINEKVLVPITGSSWDDDALATYEAAMPGYEVLGFTGSWQSTDALHCRTHGVADLELLYVYSIPVRSADSDEEPYWIAAEIVDHSETGLIADQLRVYWRTGQSGPFNYEVMTAIAGTDSFYAEIPAQPFGTTVEYYAHAADNSGRIEDYPLVGSAGPFSFLIEVDEVPPVIAGTTDLRSTENTVGPYDVETTVTDNMGVSEVTLFYRVNGGEFQALPMSPTGGYVYHAGIPGQPQVSHVEYYIQAVDNSDNMSYDPPTAPVDLYDFYVAPEENILFADMEGGSDWTHAVVTGGFNDEWHLSTQRNHTAGGTTSWKCGSTGAGDYGDRLDAGLVTESFELTIDSRLAYWQWIDAEFSSYYTGYAYDGGLLEINTGSGWEMIEPEGGYPYLIRNVSGTGPFASETGVFSGSEDWHEVSFDLSAYEGMAQLRFRFGSDSSTGGEGWYVDDVSVDGFEIN